MESGRILRLVSAIAVDNWEDSTVTLYFLICAEGAVSDRVNRLHGARDHKVGIYGPFFYILLAI